MLSDIDTLLYVYLVFPSSSDISTEIYLFIVQALVVQDISELLHRAVNDVFDSERIFQVFSCSLISCQAAGLFFLLFCFYFLDSVRN